MWITINIKSFFVALVAIIPIDPIMQETTVWWVFREKYLFPIAAYETLRFIHQRLTEVKGTNDTEVYFGVIATGDFYQLPLSETDLCFKIAGDMCQHLPIYRRTYLQW